MAKRILIVGPSSGLAEEFVLEAPAGWAFEGAGRTGPVHASDRYETVHLVDAREIGPFEFSVRANACDTVVSFLQEGDRRVCQEERPKSGERPAGVAWQINVLAIEAMGRAAVSEHKRLIVVSTDEVFPEGGGPARESEAALPWMDNPSWYGGTKAEAESLLGRLGGSVALLRVSALFGWRRTPGCDRRLADELRRSPPGSPELLQPTFVSDAAAALRRLVEDPVSGLFHVAVPEPIGRTELTGLLDRLGRGPASPPPAVSERHPGLVPGRLVQLGLRPTPVTEAVESIRENGARR